MGPVAPSVLAKPIAAAQPSDAIAPRAATTVPRTDGPEAVLPPSVSFRDAAPPRDSEARSRTVLSPTTAFPPTFKSLPDTTNARIEDHFLTRTFGYRGGGARLTIERRAFAVH